MIWGRHIVNGEQNSSDNLVERNKRMRCPSIKPVISGSFAENYLLCASRARPAVAKLCRHVILP
jgi:hypothetical protein